MRLYLGDPTLRLGAYDFSRAISTLVVTIYTLALKASCHISCYKYN